MRSPCPLGGDSDVRKQFADFAMNTESDRERAEAAIPAALAKRLLIAQSRS